MRYISPSALATFEKNREGFYLKYLADPRPPREEQSKPASAGSAFDAYVKSALMRDCLGQPGWFEKLFETQVESHNRDWARQAGQHIMEDYIACGAYQDLLDLLESAVEEPQFEFDADTKLDGTISLAGKPDCRFVHRGGAHVVLDWKVNGYCGKGNTSPAKGYALCRDGRHWPKKSTSHEKSHNLYDAEEFMGITINKFPMEAVSLDWADQLSMYAWMMGEPVGSDRMVVCIEQVVGKANGERPLLRIANHKCRVTPTHQKVLAQRIRRMYQALEEGHVFVEVSPEESAAKCAELNERAKQMISDGTPEGDFYAHCVRKQPFYNAR